jgi:hypothetical protein
MAIAWRRHNGTAAKSNGNKQADQQSFHGEVPVVDTFMQRASPACGAQPAPVICKPW